MPVDFKQVIPMPNTGVFYLQEVLGRKAGWPERFIEITRVRATCSRCSRMVHADKLPELESIAGGTILQCPGCGARQAISNARFDLFDSRHKGDIKQTPKGG